MWAFFGVAMKLDERGCEHGVQLMPFDYTEKRGISKMEADKILNHDNWMWVNDKQVNEVLYFIDHVDRIEGVG
jgi:hypothetical protein